MFHKHVFVVTVYLCVYLSSVTADDHTLTPDQKLGLAAFELNVAEVRKLLSDGANPNSRLKWGAWTLGHGPDDFQAPPLIAEYWTPLIALANSERGAKKSTWPARARRRLAIAKLLVQSGAKLDMKMPDGSTALNDSLHRGYRSLAVHLIENGASIETIRSVEIEEKGLGSGGVYPIHDAIGDPDLLKLLIAKGADLEARDFRGNTALFRATRDLELESAKLLLEAGASTSAVNSNGMTPASYVGQYGFTLPVFNDDADMRKRIAKLISEYGEKEKDSESLPQK